jgi:hypothetical protein
MSEKAYLRVGQICRYRHSETEGSGKILSVGADGVWVESLERDPWQRRRCTVRHANIVPPDQDGRPPA